MRRQSFVPFNSFLKNLWLGSDQCAANKEGKSLKKNLCSYLACSSNQASSMTEGSSVRGGGNVDVVVDLRRLVTVCLNLSSVLMMNRTIKKNFHYTYSVCTIRILLDSVNDWFLPSPFHVSVLGDDVQLPRRLHELAKTEYYTLTEDSSGHVDSSRKLLGSSRR